VPELFGKITPPEESSLRMSHAVIERWDAIARSMGVPDGWRLSHEEREAVRRDALAGRLERDLWVFAFGSVMWDPGFHAVEIRRARVEGWHRCFRTMVELGRGTPERPCLQGSLDAGGRCDGLAFRIPAAAVDEETERLCMRELIATGYNITVMPADTPQGPIEVMAFTADTACHRYVKLSEQETARIIATARGVAGSNREYLDNIVIKLRQLGISDHATERLAVLCGEIAS
jgi:cation transport protein ChaC